MQCHLSVVRLLLSVVLDLVLFLSPLCLVAVTNPLQILAAQASTSSPVTLNRPPSVEAREPETVPGEPQAKRPRAEDDKMASVPQPVIVMNQDASK